MPPLDMLFWLWRRVRVRAGHRPGTVVAGAVAGLRTNALPAAGAALFVLLSKYAFLDTLLAGMPAGA